MGCISTRAPYQIYEYSPIEKLVGRDSAASVMQMLASLIPRGRYYGPPYRYPAVVTFPLPRRTAGRRHFSSENCHGALITHLSKLLNRGCAVGRGEGTVRPRRRARGPRYQKVRACTRSICFQKYLAADWHMLRERNMCNGRE